MTKITVDKALIEQAIDYIRSTADYKMGHPAACEAVCDLGDALAESVVEPVAWMDRDGDVYKELPTPNWHPPHQALFTEAQLREALARQEAVMRQALEAFTIRGGEWVIKEREAIKALEEALK